jgi:hypothetical protein
MELHTIGIDLDKTVFHLVGLNLRGEVVARKKFSRAQLLRFTTNVFPAIGTRRRNFSRRPVYFLSPDSTFVLPIKLR